MDLIKIGKYIAGKRKSLGMTQRQLAEKLGMSDKSVSKWELEASAFQMYLFIKNFVLFLVLASMNFWLEKI